MASRPQASRRTGTTANTDNSYVTLAQQTAAIAAAVAGLGSGGNSGGSTGASKIALGTLWRPMLGVHNAANANGPIVTNNPLTGTAPNLTNMIFIPWNARDKAVGATRSRFNLQGQNWVAADSSWAPSQSACINKTSERTPAGQTGIQTQSVGGMDVNFVTNSRRVVLQFQAQGSYTNQPWYDQTILIEDAGEMKRLTDLPVVTQLGDMGFGTPTIFKDITVKGNRGVREWRYLLPGHTMLHGIWVEQGANVFPAANKPLFVLDGDSWLEAFCGGTWISGCGTDEAIGSYMTTTIGFSLILRTGAKFIFNGFGGTGFYNGFQVVADRNTYGNGKNSVFLSTMRNAFYQANFGSHKATAYLILGGGNDGFSNGSSSAPAPVISNYRDRVLAGCDGLLAADPTLPIILNGPQSIDDPENRIGGPQDQHRTAVQQAVAARPTGVLQYFDQSDYTDGPMGNTGGNPASSSWAWLAGDVLHPNIGGCKYVAKRYADDIGRLTVSTDRVAATLGVVL